MIEKIERPLSNKEKWALTAKLSSIEHRNKGFNRRFLIAMIIMLGVFSGLTMLVAASSPIVITLFWIGVGVVISLWIFIENRLRFSNRKKSLEEALDRNEADIVHIKSTEMIEFEEIEDEGAGYAFQVDDDYIVFVEGQNFYSSANFPNDDFEIVHIYDYAGKLVDMFIDRHGNNLMPNRKISSKVKKRLRQFKHLETVEGKLSNLETILSEDK